MEDSAKSIMGKCEGVECKVPATAAAVTAKFGGFCFFVFFGSMCTRRQLFRPLVVCWLHELTVLP